MAIVEGVEERAERVLASVPDWLWDGAVLPVPVERIADSCFGLLVRDIDDLARAPGAPALAPGQTFSGLLLPDAGEIWVNAGEARVRDDALTQSMKNALIDADEARFTFDALVEEALIRIDRELKERGGTGTGTGEQASHRGSWWPNFYRTREWQTFQHAGDGYLELDFRRRDGAPTRVPTHSEPG